ncbi:uncharacterized protein DFL_007485 [Arthrobotrys flagrans]|uniref:Uncharacterized protein n=1 Tax=Arthrobotrys flagrans TaxID=97331 RepID=A0A436ZWM3_ARTFL|nr:hypothetical protein DFL_007485 [Arthrobotrys flagrans]
MRWLSSAAAVQLLYLLEIATAVPDYGFGVGNGLEPRREALLLYKRQDNPFCREGYFQCPPEFGGGCCANGRKCATRDCPAIRPGEEDIPNVFTDTRPPETFTNPPPSQVTAALATSTSEPPETTGGTSTEAPETTTEPPETTTAARTTSPATTDTDTEAPTTTGPSSTGTNTGSQSGTATNAADAAATTTSSPANDGTLYTPMGISSGAIVGIVFAGITGAVIVGLVLWRAIIGIRHPRKKGKGSGPAAPDITGAAGAGAARGGAGGIFGGNRRIFGAFKNPFGGKKNGSGASEAMIPRSADDEDNTPMSQSAAAMGFGPQPVGSEGAPPYVQDRSSLEEQDTSYNRAAYTGGDLGYRGVSTYDRQDDDTQGLFPRSGGFPNR